LYLYFNGVFFLLSVINMLSSHSQIVSVTYTGFFSFVFFFFLQIFDGNSNIFEYADIKSKILNLT